jgi:hypothetical protein
MTTNEKKKCTLKNTYTVRNALNLEIKSLLAVECRQKTHTKYTKSFRAFVFRSTGHQTKVRHSDNLSYFRQEITTRWFLCRVVMWLPAKRKSIWHIPASIDCSFLTLSVFIPTDLQGISENLDATTMILVS